MPDAICEIAGCGNSTTAESVFDKYFKKSICMECYAKHFRTAEESGWGEWFDSNFKDNKTAYPPEFWRKVGAFIDVSKCGPTDPYK